MSAQVTLLRFQMINGDRDMGSWFKPLRSILTPPFICRAADNTHWVIQPSGNGRESGFDDIVVQEVNDSGDKDMLS